MRSAVADKIRIPSTLWEGMKRAGVDQADVIRRAGLPMGVLKDDSPATTAQFFALWRAIEAASGNAAIGLQIATALDAAVMPLSFVAAQHARDFRDALNRVARFKRLCAPEEVAIAEAGDRSQVTAEWPHAHGEATPTSLVDATLVSIVELGRRGTGVPIVPVKIELVGPERLKEAYETYFGCTVRFGAKVGRAIFRTQDLDRAFVTYNKELLDVLAPELDRRLEEHSNTASMAEQIKWVLRRRLTAGRPDIKAVATELAMSERSLQRRLTDEGVTFQSLLSDTRHQLALEHLGDMSLAIMEVAYMLGYEDQNSFFRAFRQWEGQTPTEWRLAQVRSSSSAGEKECAR